MNSNRNGYMLNNYTKNGYDWWWHSLTAINDNTGDLEPFFIEYYIINPGITDREPIFGQLPGTKQKPSYSMIKAGKWGNNKSQIHNFFSPSDFKADTKIQNVKILNNIATETALKGSVEMSEQDAKLHPEFMSDPGTMEWDLKVEKIGSFSVGYGASSFMRFLNLFQMFWHVEGMKTYYEGKIIYNRQSYTVKKETSNGYQDKNWGRDYTNPWLWLNCNNFVDDKGIKINCSLDIGGGNPKVAGISLGPKLLGAFRFNNKLYAFNFTKIFFQKQNWKCKEDERKIYWDIELSNRTHILIVNFSCPKDGMLLVNYENPKGEKNHNKLWNGGYASGTIILKEKRTNRVECELYGSLGGCEYGKY